MHRKSLEAAEALKNDDSGNSDREDAQSKASDISSTGNPSSKSYTHQQKQSGSMTSPSLNHDMLSSRHSVTPTSSTGPSSHVASSPVSVSTNSTIGGAQSTTPPLPPPPPASHHLSGNGGNGVGSIEPKSLLSSPTHPNFHHENDPEAFRWVDYNRDPISFIRCA